MFYELHKYNRRNLKNYIEIFIKTDLNKLKKNKSKSFYKSKTKNVWGIDLKPQYPKKPDIIIENNFDKSINIISKILFKKIKKIF